MKKIITPNERLQLLGLLTLAQQHAKIADQAREAIEKIIDDIGGYSLLTDAIYEERAHIDKMLSDMGIEVEDATT